MAPLCGDLFWVGGIFYVQLRNLPIFLCKNKEKWSKEFFISVGGPRAPLSNGRWHLPLPRRIWLFFKERAPITYARARRKAHSSVCFISE